MNRHEHVGEFLLGLVLVLLAGMPCFAQPATSQSGNSAAWPPGKADRLASSSSRTPVRARA